MRKNFSKKIIYFRVFTKLQFLYLNSEQLIPEIDTGKHIVVKRTKNTCRVSQHKVKLECSQLVSRPLK